MEIALIIAVVILVLVVIVGAVFFVIKQKDSGGSETHKILLAMIDSLRHEITDQTGKSRQELQDRLDRISEQVQKGLQHSSDSVQKQFVQSATIIKDVTDRLGKLDETNKQVLDFSKQLQSLENVLKNPKQRGVLGEISLELILANVLTPTQYQMQYKFSDGEIVDCVVFIDNKVIPIDAKFSLEKYNLMQMEEHKEQRENLAKEFKKDVKMRIDETSKYIRPGENTLDFAFMFIPAEGVYYNLLMYKVGTADVSSQDLIEYAFKKRVIIVSPTSFFAYLQTVIHGLRSLQMEKDVHIILKRVQELNKHLVTYEGYMQKLGGHLGTAVNTYNTAYKEFGKVDKDIYKLSDGEAGGNVDLLQIDKPLDTEE